MTGRIYLHKISRSLVLLIELYILSLVLWEKTVSGSFRKTGKIFYKKVV